MKTVVAVGRVPRQTPPAPRVPRQTPRDLVAVAEAAGVLREGR